MSSTPQEGDPQARFEAEYARVNENFRALTDIRFKLLDQVG
jgi:hypothetical protein